MATTAAAPAYASTDSYVGESGLWSWLTTVDHKRIGTLYLFTVALLLRRRRLEALLIRIAARGAEPAASLSAEAYNQMFTMHGTTMVFLAIMPLSAAFFNYLIPLQIGARDVAFPRLNAFSYWVFLFGGIFMNASWFFGAAPDGGWFGYTPLTTLAVLARAQHRLLGARPADPRRQLARRGVQLHHDDHQHARAGDEPDAHADVHVERVRRAVPAHPGVPGHHDRARVPAVRPLLRDELLHDRRRRRPAALAAPVLDLRAPRGLHPHPARVRPRVGDHPDVLAASRSSATR